MCSSDLKKSVPKDSTNTLITHLLEVQEDSLLYGMAISFMELLVPTNIISLWNPGFGLGMHVRVSGSGNQVELYDRIARGNDCDACTLGQEGWDSGMPRMLNPR